MKAARRLLTILMLVCMHSCVLAGAYATPQNITGFETGDAPATNNEFNFVGTTQSVQSTTVIDGGFSLQVNPTTTNNGYVSIALSGNTGQPTSFSLSDLYFGFSFRIGTLPGSNSEEFAGVRRSGAEQMTLRVNSAGNVLMFQNSDLVTTPVFTTTAALSTNTNYYIIGRVQTSATGAYQIDIYDSSCSLIESQSGTANFGTQNSEGLRLGKITNRNGQTVNFYYDNVITDNTTLPTCGGKVANLRPNANGTSTQWASGTNSSDFNEVDEALPPDNDTTYVMNAASSGQISTFNLQNTSAVSIGGSDTIVMAKAWSKCRENTTVTSSLFLRVISGANTTDTSSGFNGTTTYAQQHKTFATDPNTSSAWTTSGLDAVEVGAREANAVQDRCTAFGMQVYYIPAAPTPTPTPTATPTVTPTNTPTPVPLADEKRLLILGVGQ